MAYTNCSACGAKALVGATRCPRCQAPFVSYDIAGERVPTVNCPTCGVQRPVAIGICPNCAMSTAPSGARLMRGLTAAGLAIAAIMAVGYAISRGVDQTKQSAPADPIVVDSTVVVDSMPLRDSVPVAVADSMVRPAGGPPAVVPPAPAQPAPAQPAPLKPAPLPSVPVSDSGQWDYAVAITWVRVRSAPTRESDVLRMIDSAQRVRLGPPQNGWRPVRVGIDRGWVDPRLFMPAAAPRVRP